jgi:hypothetical protein
VEATRAPAGRISVGKVISETFSIYGHQFFVLIASAILVFVLFGLAVGLLQNEGGWVLGVIAGILELIAYALYTGFVVSVVQDVRDGVRDKTIGDLFSTAGPAIPALIGFGILFAIGVGIGLLLLVIPGLILFTMWSVGGPSIVIERVGPIEAFGRSWRLVRGDAWAVFGTLLVVLVIVIAIGVVLGAIANPIGNGATVAATIISNVLTAPIFALAASVMFFDLGGGHGARESAASATPPAPSPEPAG